MNIYFCNINKINENVEDFVIAKNKIEQPLIDNEELEKKMSIKEFLEYIDLTQNIFMANEHITIPFAIYTPQKDTMVIMYSLVDDKYDNAFKDELNRCNYNLKSLKQISLEEILLGKIEKIPYFIINGDYFI